MDQGLENWGKELADKIRIRKKSDLLSFEKGQSNWEQ